MTEPYVYKQVPNGKYTEKLKKLIGASVVWNQLADDSSISTDERSGVLFTKNSAGHWTLTGTPTKNNAFKNINYTENVRKFEYGHVYYAKKGTTAENIGLYFWYVLSGGNNINSTSGDIVFKVTDNTSPGNWVRMQVSNMQDVDIGTVSLTLQYFDLTAMFGSTIADYVYSIEQNQSGSGVAWLKKYGFFTEDYYAYSANTIQSVSVSKHITKDSDSQTLTETTLDHTTLRGIFYLDNGELKVDGDIYNADGSEDVNYEERAYESGDESLPDTITDGTTTVTKKATPTTASLTPFNPLSTIEQGGTEEFIDYGVEQGNRDVAIPCGNESVYGDNRLMAQIIKYINN